MTLFDVWTIFETHGTEKWWNFKTSRKTQTVRRDRSQLFQHLSRHAWVGKTDFKSQTDRSRARFIDMTPIMSWSTGISWKLASHAKFRYNKSTQNLQSPEHLLNRVPYFPPVDYCWPCVCVWVSEQVGQRDRGPQRRLLHQPERHFHHQQRHAENPTELDGAQQQRRNRRRQVLVRCRYDLWACGSAHERQPHQCHVIVDLSVDFSTSCWPCVCLGVGTGRAAWSLTSASTSPPVVDSVCVTGCRNRSGSVIVDLSVDFSTSLNDTFITNSVMPKILQNLMALNNSVEIDGVKYSAAVDMIFEREVPRMNGSLISADNVTACT